MKNEHDFNGLDFDYQTLTPAQWEIYKERVIQRARQERAEAIRALFRALLSSLRHAIAAAWAAVRTPSHPVFPSRGA